eukprot:149964-Pyramimonas_sp.AAC.1
MLDFRPDAVAHDARTPSPARGCSSNPSGQASGVNCDEEARSLAALGAEGVRSPSPGGGCSSSPPPQAPR